MRLLRTILTAMVLAALPLSGVRAQSDQGAMRMYHPPGSAARLAAPAASDAPAVADPPPDLPREPLAAPGGGTKVRLPSRLRAAVTRQAGDGAVHECVQDGSARE
jgi:hypothetical protein